MQKAIQSMVALGPIPSEDTIEQEELEMWDDLIMHQVQEPLTDEEGLAISGLFGPDSCFGLNYKLMHLLETAPGWPVPGMFEHMHPEWAGAIMSRIKNRDDIAKFGDIKDLPSDPDEMYRVVLEYTRENYPELLKKPEKRC